MKISGITVYEVKPRWIFVKITTDEGIEGWGEMISGTKTETVVAGAKEMGEYLLGRDPFEIERLWQEMYKSFFRGGLSTAPSSPAWRWPCGTSKGKAFGVPCMSSWAARPATVSRSTPGSEATVPTTWPRPRWSAVHGF